MPGIERIPAAEFSYAAALMAGGLSSSTRRRSNSIPPGPATARCSPPGCRAVCWVPMHFGDEVGGTLFFGKHEPYWYDDMDVEVATVIGSRMVLGIQHQRLAEEQRRLASAERRARGLEQSLKSARQRAAPAVRVRSDDRATHRSCARR